MLSKTSRKDVAKDKASDVASAVADAAEAGREKIAPVARNVTGHLSDAADKASEAAAPHVAKAKDAVTEAAAPQVAKAKDAVTEAAAPQVAKAKEATAAAAAPHLAKAKEATTAAADAAAPHVEQAKKTANKASEDVADAAAPRVKKARKTARKAAKNASKQAKQASKDGAKIKASAADRAEAAGLTKEQAHRLFADEWMPRIQETIAATTAAGTSAYAALPQQARDAVETVAPQVAKKRHKKGKVLITLGLLAGAGAVALYLSGQQKGGAKRVPESTSPKVERLDVSTVEETTAVPASDDAVGDLEKKVDASVTGSRRGRHAAQE